MEPVVACVWIFAGASAITWLLSVLTREYSWTDRLWSIIPIVYLAVFVVADPNNARLVVMLVLVTLWGVRLTLNFVRKGGFSPGGEDYRWKVLRDRMTPWQFQLFNVFFISIYQNLILLLICLPAYTAYLHPTPLGPLDIVATVLFLGFLIGETIADQQQWNFHQGKAATIAAGGAPSPRFLTTGLFRYSRHPNFFFEQAQWWVIFGFGAIAAGSPLQWTVAGPVLLTLLFLGSTAFTESITKSKYPEYAEYQRTTSAQIPWFPLRRKESSLSPSVNG
jgi:steroid 5-alpha reductase family enzyme